MPDPARPRTHRYTDQPVGRILRSLAEQAEINYVEPGIPENEVTSIVLTNMTPLQAFEAVARAHGFKIQIDRQERGLHTRKIGYHFSDLLRSPKIYSEIPERRGPDSGGGRLSGNSDQAGS